MDNVQNFLKQIDSSSDSESIDSKQYQSTRYNVALKMLIPFRPFSKSQNHPNDNAGLFSILTFSWLSGLVWRIYKKPLTSNELWKISEYDQTRLNYKRLSKIWKKEVGTKGIENASLHIVLWKFVRTRMIFSSLCFLLFGFAIFINSSIVIQKLLLYVSSNSDSSNLGLILISSLIVAEVTRACMLTLFFILNYRTCVRARSAVLLLIFKKVMKMSSNLKKTSIGDLITMCSNDGDRIFEVMRTGNGFFLAPLLFIVGTAYNCYFLGPVSLLGSLVFVLVIPLQAILIKIMNKIRFTAIQQAESRINKTNEVFSLIKMIKMYAWENCFTKTINSIRKKELSALKKSAILQSINISIAFLSPVFSSVLMICAFVLLKNPLTPELAFTAIALYNVMAYSLKFMPISIKSIAEANIALNRFKQVLALDSLHNYVIDQTKDKNNAIEIENASFSWISCKQVDDTKSSYDQTASLISNKDVVSISNFILNDINLFVEKGSLIGVFGAVGSGKSSFVAGLLGEMVLFKGSVAVSGSIAYCSQQAWLMNTTIRENILFGSAYDFQKYQNVITLCQLLKDFKMFQNGDLTEVGEHGLNLSGGQKQRISIARALYSDKDIYVLDDPLSALDAHVGKSIFMEIIIKKLKNNGKTVLLVTHQMQYLPYCDKVLQAKNSTLILVDLKAAGSNLEETFAPKSDNFDQSKSIASDLKNVEISIKNEIDHLMEGKLVSSEESGGKVMLSTYQEYVRACGGYFCGFLIILLFLINVGCQLFSNLWLSYWLRSESAVNSALNKSSNVIFSQLNQSTTALPSVNLLLKSDLHFFLCIYGLSAVAMFIISIIRGYAYVSMTIHASKVLHAKLFQVVLHGTMEFFDTTPIGRILNRFQKDTDEQDVMLPCLLEMFLFNASSVFIAVCIVSFVFPKFIIVVSIIFLVFLVLYIVFKPSVREMRRLDVLTRSPWFAHITTVVSGLTTIRTYLKTENFIDKFCCLLDQNSVPYYLFLCVNRWLSLRLDALTIISSAFISILVVLDKNIVSPAFAGLALSTMFLINGMLQFTTRLLIETQARFVCTDRIKYYFDNIPQENNKSFVMVNKEWPKNGKINFCNVCLKYRKGLPLVLRNLSFCFNSGEKIGVVGRTGSGKSSLAAAMFRLVELHEGKILLDDTDISKLSLNKLRSSMSIIPQDPALFSGSVRYNLDPFNAYNDFDIWSVLELVHLKNKISSLSGQLTGEVNENGGNFSVGEKQLICLARALLRKSKILFLDEATAAIDRETEMIVQSVIDKVFSNSTVITIAHRLATVANSDRVLVLEEGTIVEFDKPQNLLKDKNSAFYKMNQVFQEKFLD